MFWKFKVKEDGELYQWLYLRTLSSDASSRHERCERRPGKRTRAQQQILEMAQTEPKHAQASMDAKQEHLTERHDVQWPRLSEAAQRLTDSARRRG
ncbi:hypothetical protein SAMN00790413_06271 [Deinococcus hopiensis KR-140]|uniref:Uncharacterized protein n=1 Tax=Deinococcus hopiensis KR-140 TaxID=695939 RepID=A0A1W1VUD9_9DEIO|nr:hypothetical protein SAMN00790413_06271 [Deinococcus hopiensis KR-140]